MSNCEASANDVQKLISEEIRVSIANMVIEVTDAAVKEEYFAGREP